MLIPAGIHLLRQPCFCENLLCPCIFTDGEQSLRFGCLFRFSGFIFSSLQFFQELNSPIDGNSKKEPVFCSQCTGCDADNFSVAVQQSISAAAGGFGFEGQIVRPFFRLYSLEYAAYGGIARLSRDIENRHCLAVLHGIGAACREKWHPVRCIRPQDGYISLPIAGEEPVPCDIKNRSVNHRCLQGCRYVSHIRIRQDNSLFDCGKAAAFQEKIAGIVITVQQHRGPGNI